MSASGSKSLSWDCNQDAGQGFGLNWRLNLGRIHFQAHSHGWWQDSLPHRLLGLRAQFPTGCCHRLPSVPCLYRGHLTTAAVSPHKQAGVHMGKTTVSLQPNLGSDIHDICCFLFVESELVGLTYTQREKMTEGNKCQKVGIIGDRVRSCPLRSPKWTPWLKFYILKVHSFDSFQSFLTVCDCAMSLLTII